MTTPEHQQSHAQKQNRSQTTVQSGPFSNHTVNNGSSGVCKLMRPDNLLDTMYLHQPSSYSWRERFAWTPILLFFIFIGILWILDIPGIYESRLLLALNFFFCTIEALFVVFLISRSFLSKKTPELLFLGCGMLFWGTAGILAISFSRGNFNITVTIYNLCLWCSGVCHLAGTYYLRRPHKAIRFPVQLLKVAYLATIILLGAITLLAAHHLLPTFFIDGQGGTHVRHCVLVTAIAMFAASALLFGTSVRRAQSTFRYWYSLSLGLVAVGLFGMMIESSGGSILSWTARATHFLSNIYMFIATMASVRILHLWEISLEDVVREMQQRYSSLVDISPDAITVHRDNKVVFVNQAALTLFGASSADQLLGRSPFEFLHPSYHATMSKRIAYMYAGHSVSLVESQIVRLDGTTAFVEIAAAPFKEQGTTAIQVVLRNITERKKAEEILKRDKVALEALIAERTRELLQANKDLEQAQRMADIGRLSATIAHELRTPLAGIKAAAFNIQKKINSQTIDKHLLTINKKVLESDQIIQNLLNFTRIKAVEYAPVQCAEILRECTSAIAARYASWKIRLEEDDQYNEDETIDADATQLRMLFCNILDNAYQSCHGGGSGMIRVSIIQIEEMCTVSISDNGTGIEEGDIPKVFEPFYTTRAKGTGLGLTVCREIVEMHHGRITVKSEKGRGTEVILTLPCHQPSTLLS